MTRLTEDIDAIKQLVEDWHAGWLASDIEALLSLYADDPVLMPQNQPAVVGKETIRFEAEVSGDWGYFRIAYTLTATPKTGALYFNRYGYKT